MKAHMLKLSDMNSRSVDGPRRRSGSNSIKVNVSTSKAELKGRNIYAPKKVNRSTISDVRKPRTSKESLIADTHQSSSIERGKYRRLNEVIEDKKTHKLPHREKKTTHASTSTHEEESKHVDKAAKEFLAEFYDSNATSFNEDIPMKDKKKSWRKQQKAAKKAAKRDSKMHKKKKHKIWPIIVLILVLIICAAGFFVYNFLNDNYQKVVGDDSSILGLIFADEDTPLLADEKGRTNILIFGTEGASMVNPEYDGGFLTDSMMLVSLNQDSGDVKAISLPRDLHYTKGACTGTAKLNEIYYCQYVKNDGSEESMKIYEERGQDALASAFEDILGIKIQYKAHANWAAMVSVIDALGGIDVVFTYGSEEWSGPETAIEVTDKRGLRDIYGGRTIISYPTNEVIHLDGWNALTVARTRNSHGGYGAGRGNFSREYFQQRIIEATVKKARETNFLTDISAATGLINAVGDNVRTTFKDSDIKTLMRLAKDINIENMETLSTVENYDGRAALMKTGMINEISYVIPYGGDMSFNYIHNFIQDRLYAEGFSREMAQIVVLNGTGTSGIAANETIDLQDEGFQVSSIGNAPDDLQDSDKTIIYQLSSDKSETAKKLIEKYGVELVTEVPESLSKFKVITENNVSKSTDFIILIGNDHFESAK